MSAGAAAVEACPILRIGYHPDRKLLYVCYLVTFHLAGENRMMIAHESKCALHHYWAPTSPLSRGVGRYGGGLSSGVARTYMKCKNK